MATLKRPAGDPGVLGLLFAFPESESAMNSLARTVLTGPSSLSRAERQLIAAFVSTRNGCEFCRQVHATATRCLLGSRAALYDDLLINPAATAGPRLQSLLAIAETVRKDARPLDAAVAAAARAAGLDDPAIHDAVLVASMVSMFNRYVSGLGAGALADPAITEEIGRHLAAADDVAEPIVVLHGGASCDPSLSS